MATVNALRPLLDRKAWAILTPAPVTTAAGVFMIANEFGAPYAPTGGAKTPRLYMAGVSSCWLYCRDNDSFVEAPNSGLAGTFGAGNCGCLHPHGQSGTATAGGATTITTAVTLPVRLDGYAMRITGGTGAGQQRTIASNTLGANSVITVTSAWDTNPDATSTFVLFTGRFYVWIAGTGSTFGLRYFDFATMAWSGALDENLAATATWATDGKIVSTAGALASPFATGTATAGGGSTLTDSGKTWATNQLANSQVRITAGTGVGQVRTIASNTGTVLTTSAAWSTNPDATSVYAIEGNDDYLYLIGNNAVALYRYSISGNAWTTLTPGVARAGAPGAGCSLNWIANCTDTLWTDESAIQNGRYLYSFRGGASTAIDKYDIAANSWSAVTYGPTAATFTTGSSFGYDGDTRIYAQKDATNRWFFYDVVRNTLCPFSTCALAHGAALAGDKTWVEAYVDGATKIKFVHTILNTSTTSLRVMVI